MRPDFVILLLKMLIFLQLNNIKGEITDQTSATKFCPKKHIRSHNSCYMYYLKPKTLAQSESICFVYSDWLVSMETIKQWKDLLYQLNNLRLRQYSFRIGLEFNFTSKFWKWTKFRNQRVNDHLIWCKEDKLDQNSHCASLVFDQIWCLRKVSCFQEESFICEWRPEQFRRYNTKLGKSLKILFYIFSLFGLGCLIILFIFLIQFFKYSKVYLNNYYEEMKKSLFNLKRNQDIYFKKSILNLKTK